MKNVELAVGAGLIVLGLICCGTCLFRAGRGAELEGLQYVAVSNFFMGLFLIMFALDRSGGVTGTVMLVSICLGLGAGVLVLINTVRQAGKDPFD
ncbi:hypothetical protein [Actinomadura geliboluensis]|uniref:Uncharacterized protein n=1 Tax=Actinomadura geliboluensis TaxID=882440 RepID=A0A5S4GBJ9_9ACTN|nr:hypothetical protein [Actinomadura geliboluensis]TMR30388.1 hypothetical protein ETD96_33735 [Actinomadura geliboluensis]